MNCLEILTDIIRIEAYKLKDIYLLIPFTHSMTLLSSCINISGTPERIFMKENSAESRCVLSTGEAGDLYENSLSWQAEGNGAETLRQIGLLSASRMHYIITSYDGTRRLLYNWCGMGRTLPDQSVSGNEGTAAMSFKVSSRMPVLTIV